MKTFRELEWFIRTLPIDTIVLILQVLRAIVQYIYSNLNHFWSELFIFEQILHHLYYIEEYIVGSHYDTCTRMMISDYIEYYHARMESD